MYKLLALDMDGTLLNSKVEIEDSSKKAIKAAQEKNVMVTISTGRPIQGVTKYIDELNIEAPVITYNGAVVVDSKSNEILYNKGLNADDAIQVIEMGLARDVSIIIWSDNKLYVNRIDEDVEKYELLIGISAIVIEEYSEVVKNGITKVLWIDTIEKIQEYMNEISEEISDTVNYCTSKPYFLEFFDCNVSKASALDFIRNMYNINVEEIMAIGDGYNDLPMIEYAGLGVAMGNAEIGVKEKADYITKSNDEHGIEHAINRFILSE